MDVEHPKTCDPHKYEHRNWEGYQSRDRMYTKDGNPRGMVTGLGRRSALGRVTFILRRYTTLRRTMFVLPTKPLYKLRGGIIIKKWENF